MARDQVMVRVGARVTRLGLLRGAGGVLVVAAWLLQGDGMHALCAPSARELQSPEPGSKVVALEAPFGKAEIDVAHPSIMRLWLREPGGSGERSLLAEHGPRSWAHAGYTYAVAEDGRRYESRLSAPGRVDILRKGGRQVLRIRGVRLSHGQDESPIAIEDWTLSTPGEGVQLEWRIVRRWQKDFTATCSGSPGLFFSFDRGRTNSTTSTLWYDPLWVAASPSPVYALHNLPARISENHMQMLRDRDTWAILKLWTNWRTPSDLRLEVAGGYLYRRGSFAQLSEAGAVTGPNLRQVHRKGEVEKITLCLGGVDKSATGYQLALSLPDKDTESSLRDFYGSVFNGGAVNDQKGFDFGNESDGWYYAGSCWMYGATLAAGVPAAGRLSARPYDASQAFREHLAHIFSVTDERGRAHFGYNQGGEWVDDNLHTIIGAHFYLLHSGDLDFVRECLPVMERALAYFIERRGPQGLFKLDAVGAHWYYDAITTGGINGYYNAFFYKAALDLAEMEEAAGRREQARWYGELAAEIKAAFNRVLWKEDAVGGPRYLDWIDGQGQEVSYFCDLCQWPPIAVGIASADQAGKIVATADARIAQLEKEQGYAGYAALSALWPVPAPLNPLKWQTFGRYMNGGSLLCQTYWEIVARSRAGDAAGAARRLQRFARRASEIRWAGDNAADIHGEMAHGDTEPYLADMVAVTAAAMHGPLGIQPTWDKLVVAPCLPREWPQAAAEVLYKGRRHRVTIADGEVQVQPLEAAIALPPLWLMDFNLRKTADGEALANHIDFAGAYDNRMQLAVGATWGSYQSPAHHWAVPCHLAELTVAVDLNGGQANATVEVSDDAFRTAGARVTVAVVDGVKTYSLKGLGGRSVRVWLELVRPSGTAASPVVDGFRLVGSREPGAVGR